MAAEIVMPRLSDTMEEGRIIKWLKQVGDPVKEGEPLLEVETDKADIEVEAFDTGILLEIIADDSGIIEDMPNWCKTTGQEFLGIEQNDDEYRAYVKKIK